jgi:hypothetical protein
MICRNPKRDILESSMARHLACRCPFDPSKTRTTLTFDWKKGQTPANYGPYSERKFKFTIQVDPVWRTCASRFEDSRLLVRFFGGKTSEEALTSIAQLADMMIDLSSSKAGSEAEGRFLCADKPKFIGWEFRGLGECAVLNGKREMVSIHCE